MSDDVILHAQKVLRAYHAGELQFDEHLRPVKFVIDPQGQIIAPAMVAMFEAADTVLFLPQADEQALQLQITMEQFQETGEAGALADRWRIFHGEPDDVYWAILHVDAAKYEGCVIDGMALTIPNPFTADEPRLCREVNTAHQAGLKTWIKQQTDLEIDDPRMVGVDPLGVDVRGPFDIIRVAFDNPMNDPSEVESFLQQVLNHQ